MKKYIIRLSGEHYKYLYVNHVISYDTSRPKDYGNHVTFIKDDSKDARVYSNSWHWEVISQDYKMNNDFTAEQIFLFDGFDEHLDILERI